MNISTENEQTLLSLIRSSKDPAVAFVMAIDIIQQLLKTEQKREA